MPKRSRLVLIGLVWTAAFLRIHSLFTNHFHADEALFASWARLIAIWRDPLLLTQGVDKPPLVFYLQGLFYPLIGPEEWAARLPNAVASLLLVPMVAVLAWHFYRSSTTSTLAALFITLSPLAIQFSSTAFTDPALGILITASVLFVIYRPYPALSGLIFGLAVATKHQAWLFLPLLFGLAWLRSWGWRQVRWWLIGFTPILILLVTWEVSRSGDLLLLSRQIDNFGGVRLIRSWEMLGRLEQWGQLWQMSLGTWTSVGLFLLSIVILYTRAIHKRDETAKIDVLLIIFIAGYLILHWLLAVPVWDRYMLPLIPFIVILMARGITWMISWLKDGADWLRSGAASRAIKQTIPTAFLLLILIFQLPGAYAARDGFWPLGGRTESDQGAWQVAEFLADEPYGTVLYDHWYSWQWQYHLIDKKVYVSWFQHPKALLEDLAVFGNIADSRYLVLPATGEALPVIRAISTIGFDLTQVMRSDYEPGMILYRIERREEIK